MADDTHNVMSGRGGSVVQARSIDTVNISLRTKPLIVILLALVVIAAIAADGVWALVPADPAIPLSVTFDSRLGKVGWLVPDHGETRFEWRDGPPATEAVPAQEVTVRLTVHGLTDSAVVLEGLRFDIVTRRPVRPGIYLSNFVPCTCNVVPIRGFTVNADAPRPTVRAEPENKLAISEVVDFPYKVTRQDPEKLAIKVAAGSADVEWRLYLDWSTGHGVGHYTIDDNGQPFRIAGSDGSRVFCLPADDPVRWIPRVDPATCDRKK